MNVQELAKSREKIWSSISKLSELRSEYSCFDEKEEPFYHALSLGIKGIKALDYVDAIEKIRAEISELKGTFPNEYYLAIIDKYRKELSNE